MDWIEGRVLGRHDWTEHHHSLRIEAPLPEFEAGQFVRLGLEIDGALVGRPYSLVNPPREPTLEVYFDVVPGGPLSPRLARLDAGAAISLGARAHGFLVLSQVPEGRDLWLMASGTGIGPFLSILRTDEAWQRFENVRLVQAVRLAHDLAYAETIAAIAARHGTRFRHLPFVSREACDFAMPGRIPAALASGALQAKAELEIGADASRVMLCGNPGMVADTTSALAAFGLVRHRRGEDGQICQENYW